MLQKTGRARGYAFIEFMYPEVAKVVAETMNNYLMHKKILVGKKKIYKLIIKQCVFLILMINVIFS